MSEVNFAEMAAQIEQLKKERQAVILSHFYQPPEIQDLADLVGDSLELARKAAETDARVIVFCGVHFMAESAAVLSPEKTVLLPELKAGCPMADTITAQDLQEKRRELPGAQVVCYINTSAEVKAGCDISCTSANAARVVNSLPEDQPVFFVPDKNLGRYVAEQAGRNMYLWEGCCPVHDQLTASDVIAAKEQHPKSLVLAHPECRPEVLELAGHVASTAGMLKFAGESSCEEFIIATEEGILHQFHKLYPTKKFYMASDKLVCRDMKLITVESVLHSLQTLEPRVTVPAKVREQAVKCLERMLAVE